MRGHAIALGMAALLMSAASGQAQVQEAALVADGKVDFNKVCGNCHADQPGKSKIGPSLFGVVGRESGTDGNFTYSSAMKGAHLTWDAQTLDKYLENPKGMVPGTKMGYAGVKQADQRQALIAYLNSLH
jgi:cytochrome c